MEEKLTNQNDFEAQINLRTKKHIFIHTLKTLSKLRRKSRRKSELVLDEVSHRELVKLVKIQNLIGAE